MGKLMGLMAVLGAIPVPRDIPLPLPADRVLLEGLAVLVFLAHILFVNLMVGGSLIVLACELIGLRRRDFDALARQIAATVTVNKSLAVVLGVGPLLVMNVMYTVWFYSANALTGTAWIMIVPLVAMAFLLSYAHKYSWERLAHAKRLHIALGATATLIFLLVPLIFLANINLMLFPAKWTQVRGFHSAMMLPNVWPRYLHFVLACVAVTALFLVLYLTRRGSPVETTFERLTRPRLRRGFYTVALVATLLQFLAGPLVYFTLPAEGMSWLLMVVVLVAVTLATGALACLWWEITSVDDRVGRLYLPAVGLIMCTGFAMGYARHLYREEAIRDHRELIAARTTAFEWLSLEARGRARAASDADDGLTLGERVYRNICGSCHAVDRVVVGPPLTEIGELYRGNAAGIVEWARAPGKKRKGMQPMPAFRLPAEQLEAVAEFMLNLAGGTTRPAEAGPRTTALSAPWP